MSSEALLQQTLVAALRLLYPDLLISLSMSGVSLNGTTKQNSQTMQSLQMQGFIKGLPDLVLYLPNGKLLNLELKKPNGGIQSVDQINVQSKLLSLGHNYHLIRDTQSVFDLIMSHTSNEFRLSQRSALSIRSDTIATSHQFMHWTKGTKLDIINAELDKYYQ